MRRKGRRIAWTMAGVAGVVVCVVAAWGQQTTPAARQGELEQLLRQRYPVSEIGKGVLGLTGGEDKVRRAAGTVVVLREGFFGATERAQTTSMSVRADALEIFRGRKDQAIAVGERFYVHSLYVGTDVVVLGLLSAREVATGAGLGRLWASVSFFLPAELVRNYNAAAIVGEIEKWIAPESATAMPMMSPANLPPPPGMPPVGGVAAAARPAAELQTGMTREQVVAALGTPQREVSFGARAWMNYAGLVVQLENGKLAAVDRSGQQAARVTVKSEPDGADVYVDESFVGSTPAQLELPAGTYKIRVSVAGYKDWQREVKLLAGSQITLNARMEK